MKTIQNRKTDKDLKQIVNRVTVFQTVKKYAEGLHFSEGNNREYSFSRADWRENTVNPKKEKRLGDLKIES